MLFYDEHVIDLSHRMCAIKWGEDTETKEKPNSNLAVSAHTKNVA